MAHNFYRLQGGEDVVFEDECWLLEQAGHEVVRFEQNNHVIDEMGRVDLVRKTFSNRETEESVRRLIRETSPDVCHCANTFPLISPAIYRACHDEGVPVVQTLHNFRYMCPAGTLLRDGRVCTDCVGRKIAWPGVVHKCYQHSFAASAVSASMHAYHRFRGTWTESVDAYIVLTEHSRQQFIEAGLPEDKLHVKPNFVRPDPGYEPNKGDHAVFVGRLSPEKGIDTLLDAWSILGDQLRLRIVGDGPLRSKVVDAARRNPSIEYLGQRSHAETMAEIRTARMLVFPSIWYETFGRCAIEAKACGTPVIASNHGAMAELVRHGETGWLFEPGNAADLAKACRYLMTHTEVSSQLSASGRADFEQRFAPEANLRRLLDVYRAAGMPAAKLDLAIQRNSPLEQTSRLSRTGVCP